MERTHPRAIRPPVPVMALASRTPTTMGNRANSPVADGLVARGVRIARSLLVSRKCVTTETMDTCEKPVASTNTLLGVLVAGGVIIVVVVLCVLFFLHRRRTKADKAEVENDPHELSDYGLDDAGFKKGGKAGKNNNLSAPHMQQHRLSAQELMDAQNPFGNGAELADSDRVSARGSPPRYPGDAHVKM